MSVPHVQTKREIQRLLAGPGVRPRKRFGQHFLVDGNLMRRVAAAADLTTDDLVIEVGGGTGGLTDLLVVRAAQVVCVELDKALFELLTDRFADTPNLRLLPGDCLEGKHRIRADLAACIRDFTAAGNGAVKLVANLPYQVATPLVLNLLVGFPAVRRLVFTVQAEVGDRLVARPGGKSFGPLAIVSQLTCCVDILTRIGPQAFWPRPAVDSVLVRMDLREHSPVRFGDLEPFAAFVRAVFDHRRKTIKGALSYVVEEGPRDRVCQEFDPQGRPESFSVQDWVRMFQIVRAQGERPE